MIPYWIKFIGRTPACVEAANPQSARTLAKELTGCEVTACDVLPYPASPQLNRVSGCPPFCHSPEQCKGRTACPQHYACSE